MSHVLRASHSKIKDIHLEMDVSKVTGMTVTVSIDYINDNGDLVTSVDDTIAVWATMSPEMQAGVQAIVDAMAGAVDAKYFN